MRNSWGFRGAQRSSFSHCAHGPPVALALRAPFQRRNIPEERSDPPTSYSTRVGARLPCCIMYMRCRITTCHPGFTGKKMLGRVKLHLPLTCWGFGTLMKTPDNRQIRVLKCWVGSQAETICPNPPLLRLLDCTAPKMIPCISLSLYVNPLDAERTRFGPPSTGSLGPALAPGPQLSRSFFGENLRAFEGRRGVVLGC